MDLAEKFITSILREVLSHSLEDLEFLNERQKKKMKAGLRPKETK